MPRPWTKVFLVLVMSVVLGACSSAVSPSPQAVSPSPQSASAPAGATQAAATATPSAPAQIDFWTLNLKGLWPDPISAEITKIETAHPDIKIKWVDIPDFTTTDTKLTAAISAGTAPCVVNVVPFMLPKFQAAGALTAIEDIDPSVQSLIQPSMWKIDQISGKTYGIPFYGTGPATLYNADLFTKAGLDPNKPPTTWDEVFKDAAQITSKTGVAGMIYSIDNQNDAGNTLDWFARRGVPLLSPDGKSAAFDTPEAVHVLQQYVDAYKAGAIHPDSLTDNSVDALQLVGQGKAAMTFNAGWAFNWMNSNGDPAVIKAVRIAPAPLGESGTLNWYQQVFAIPSQCKYPKQALQVAVAFAQDMATFRPSAFVLPGGLAGANDPSMSAQPIQVMLSQAKLYTSFWPMVPQVSELMDAMRTEFQNAALGKKTSKQALADAATNWNKILNR